MRLFSNFFLHVAWAILFLPLAVLPQRIAKSDKDSLNSDEGWKKMADQNGQIFWGVMAGYNLDNIYGKDIGYIFSNSKTSWIPGFHIGMHVETRLNPYLSFFHEATYSRRGAGVTLADSVSGTYASRLRADYVDVYPLSVAVGIKGFRLYAGPYVGALCSASLSERDSSGHTYMSKTLFGTPGDFETGRKYLQKLDFGIHAGMGYFSKWGLFAQLRYMRGFWDIFQYANSYTLEDSKTDKIHIFHHNLLFSIGYRLGAKK